VEVTIVIYGTSTGNFLLGAKLGIMTSLSKAAIARIHAWGWDRWAVKLFARRPQLVIA
jgi:hypothetical protein